MEGFETNLDTLMIFFRYCRRYKVDTEAERVAILRRFVKRKEARYLRDPAAYIAGKKVLKITKREPK